MSTLFGFGIGCVDTDYGRVQVEICACITKSMKRRCSALYWHTARRWWRGSMVRASFERDAFLCLLSRVLGRLHVCVCVCVCVRFVRAFKVNHVWNIHTVTGGVTCCGLNAPTTGAGATPLRNICHNHHHIMFTVALNECIVLSTLPTKARNNKN